MHDIANLASHIQHTLIEPGVCAEEIVQHCLECVQHGFDAAMVPANWVALARETLADADIKVATAVDFPFGAMTTDGKLAEVRAVVAAGAEQIDVGTQIGMLRSGDGSAFHDDLAAVVDVAGVPVKAILELALLDQRERELAVQLAVEAGVAFVKNASSGSVATASQEEIRFLRDRVPPDVGVKASGGIATREHAIGLVQAGADLIGTSKGVSLVAKSTRVAGAY